MQQEAKYRIIQPVYTLEYAKYKDPVLLETAASTTEEQELLNADHVEMRKSDFQWFTEQDVLRNLKAFQYRFSPSIWNRNDKAKIFLLWYCLSMRLRKKLNNVGWVQACLDSDPRDGTFRKLENWLRQWYQLELEQEVKEDPVLLTTAASCIAVQEWLLADLMKMRKSDLQWATRKDLLKNLKAFQDTFLDSVWRCNKKAQIFLLWHCLPEDLRLKLDEVRWVQACIDSDPHYGTFRKLENWLRQWYQLESKEIMAQSAIRRALLKQGPRETLESYWDRVETLGEDAFGQWYTWDPAVRLLVAKAFIKRCRHKNAWYHLEAEVMASLDVSKIYDHLDRCARIFGERGKLDQQRHPLVMDQSC